MKIRYSADFNSHVSEKIKLEKFHDKRIKIATLKTGCNKLIVDFEVEESSLKDVIRLTDFCVKHYENVFLFEENKKIKFELELIDDNGENKILNERLKMRDSIIIKSNQDNFENLKENLENYSYLNSSYATIYTETLKLDSVLGQYVLLYSILSAMVGSQKKVDAYIKKQEPEIQYMPTTRKNSNAMETIYTNIRNQIAHSNEETDITSLKKDVNKLLSGLNDIVKKKIFTD